MAKQAKVGERGIPLNIVLSVLTCGLFTIYWFIVLAGDIKRLRGGTKPNGVTDLILGIITCGIYLWYCYYQYPKYIVEIQEKRGVTVNDISTLSLIVGILGLGIVSLALIQNEVNKIVTARK
jgi:hypothetical protein